MTPEERGEQLLRWLREQPGSITAAVAPAGSVTPLVELLCSGLDSDNLEIAGPRTDPLFLGARAEELGRQTGFPVLLLPLEREDAFGSKQELARFWKALNFQREQLASGNVRTCLLLSPETEEAFASLAKDLWDWTTMFRFTEPLESTLEPLEDPSEVFSSLLAHIPSGDIGNLRSRWLRARARRMPAKTVAATYGLPLFLALVPEEPQEAVSVWQSFRKAESPGFRPEANLRAAQALMTLAGKVGSPTKEELIVHSLAIASAVERLLAGHEERSSSSELRVLQLAVSSDLYRRAGEYREALARVGRCLEALSDIESKDRFEKLEDLLLEQERALCGVLTAMEPGLDDPARVSSLLEPQPGESADQRSHRLGLALRLVVSAIVGPTSPIAPLMAAWLLSNERRLIGPELADILGRDPVAYLRGIELLLERNRSSRWKGKLLDARYEC